MRLKLKIVLVLAIVFVSGCVTGDGTDPQPSFIDGRSLEVHSSDRFVVNGSIYYSATATESVVFRDVMICLYDEDGTLIGSSNIGTLRPETDRPNVSVTANRRPHIVVVDHPRFREYDVDLFVWKLTNGTIREGEIHDIDAFEYRPPSRPGHCGRTG